MCWFVFLDFFLLSFYFFPLKPYLNHLHLFFVLFVLQKWKTERKLVHHLHSPMIFLAPRSQLLYLLGFSPQFSLLRQRYTSSSPVLLYLFWWVFFFLKLFIMYGEDFLIHALVYGNYLNWNWGKPRALVFKSASCRYWVILLIDSSSAWKIISGANPPNFISNSSFLYNDDLHLFHEILNCQYMCVCIYSFPQCF